MSHTCVQWKLLVINKNTHRLSLSSAKALIFERSNRSPAAQVLFKLPLRPIAVIEAREFHIKLGSQFCSEPPAPSGMFLATRARMSSRPPPPPPPERREDTAEDADDADDFSASSVFFTLDASILNAVAGGGASATCRSRPNSSMYLFRS